MLLRPEDQFHVGIVVHEFVAARDWLTKTFDYRWGADIQVDYTMQLPDGPLTYQQRLQYSVRHSSPVARGSTTLAIGALTFGQRPPSSSRAAGPGSVVAVSKTDLPGGPTTSTHLA